METRPKPAVPAGSLALRGGDREAAAGGDAAGRPAEHREAPADGLDFLQPLHSGVLPDEPLK